MSLVTIPEASKWASEHLKKDILPTNISKFINKIVCGSAVDVMKEIPDGSVHLVITSPPYNLKNSTGNGMKDGRGGKWANAALQNGLLQDRQDIVSGFPVRQIIIKDIR